MKKTIIIGIIILSIFAIAGCNKADITAPVAVAPTAQNDLESWTTYQNENLNFEIKYPTDWEIKIASNGNEFLIKSPGEIAPGINIVFSNEDYTSLVNKEQNANLTTDIKFSNQNAKEFLYYDAMGSITQKIIVPTQNQTIIISSFKSSSLEPVLNTFRFLESF